ncbi:FAD-dependent oxidoreductase [Asanoa ishikariensis]|uniref:Pyridine nucleotide-disulfide oxidoreductase domain-containing protein 2 n=1 Tax=Asanoa ishikariensis TaxID=137265 RepID=A0A1H3UGE1_9ACTN|nr:FAD-dependent oxidoreductase [Asanoa ishikariensis]SDZ61523.1 Phytoene dehydrogenase-related protein [Asanoa ishikariensis]
MAVRTVDAVVIGAGHNGLVAANLLADAGWEVLVLEATDTAGGAVRTAELTVPGFHHDVYSAFYPLGAASPVLRELDLESHGLAWHHAPAVLAHVLPDDRCAVLSRDVDSTAASLAAFDERDAEAWTAEVRRWERVGSPFLEAILRPFPPVRAGARLAARLGPAGALDFARFSVLPVREFGRERFHGEGARLLFAGGALHTDLGPEQAGSALYGWLLAMLGQSIGFPVPVGGAGQLVSALLRRLSARGGTVEYGRPVARVLHARGTAVGVEDVHGEHVRARRAVLADVPAPFLYSELVGLDALPAGFTRHLRGFQWDNSTIKVDWALSAPVPWTAAGARGAGTVHLGSLAGLTAYGAALARGEVPSEPFVLIGQMTTSDPSRSPAGTESLWAYTHVPQQAAGDVDRLQAQAELMEDLIERHAPGFRSSILGRHVQLPGDLEHGNPSLFGGAINGGTSALHQQLFFRPVPGLGRADTPIDRLYLAGSSAHPGGGVHGGPGSNAAHAALARNGAAGPAYAAVVGALHRRLYR